MKNTHITEIMSRKELNVLKINDCLNSLDSLQDCVGAYVVDDENVLKGRIDKRRLLEFMGSSLMIIDGKSRQAFLERVCSLTMDDVMEYFPEALSLNSGFADILQKFESAERESLPVVDQERRLIGEVSCGSILDYLGRRDDSVQAESAGILRAV
jgi:Mg/Co/Ni transporter MgtE